MLRATFILCTLLVRALSSPIGCTELCAANYRDSSSSSKGGYNEESTHRRIVLDSTGSSNSLNSNGNWHRADSWKTNDGHGRVHEEEGQIVDGSTKINYYRKNYTSSYVSGDTDLGHGSSSMILPDIRSEMERLENRLDRHGHPIVLDRRPSMGTNIGTGYKQQTSHERYEESGRSIPLRSDDRRPEVTVYERTYVPSSRSLPVVETGRVYEQTQTSQTRLIPTDSNYGNERHVETIHIVPNRVPVQRYEERWSGSSQRSESDIPRATIDTEHNGQRSWIANHDTPVHGNVYSEWHDHQGQMTTGGFDLGELPKIPVCSYPINKQRSDLSERQRYKRRVDFDDDDSGNKGLKSTHFQREAKLEFGHDHQQRSKDSDDFKRRSSEIHKFSHERYHRENNWHSGHSEFHHRHHAYDHRFDHNIRHDDDSAQQSSGKFDYGQQVGNFEFDQSSQQHDTMMNAFNDFGQKELGYTYQRGDDLSQEVSEHLDNDQQLAKFAFGGSTQQHETLTEGSSGFGQVELGQNTEHGQLEFGGSSQQHENLMEQSSGFERVPLGHNDQYDEDLSQQTSGKFDHGLQLGKFEFDQSSQQHETPIEGSSSFGKISQNIEHREDMMQQTSGKLDRDQHLGKIEFGEPDQQHETLAEQSSSFEHVPLGHNEQHREDLTQQTSGKFDHGLEFGNSKFDQSSQQHETLLEESNAFGKNDQNTEHEENLTQETSGKFDHDQHLGKFEFDQSSQQHETLIGGSNDFGKINQNVQHGKDMTQQLSGKFDHDQHLGKFEFGESSQQHETLAEQSSGFEHLPLAQHREDLTQQASEKFNHGLEFGNSKFDQSSQQHETLMEGSNDFEKIDQNTQHDEDLTQQTFGKFDHGQHLGKFEFDQSSQQHETLMERPNDFGKNYQITQHDEDLTQQTSGKFDHEQHLGKFEFDQSSQQHETLIEGSRDFGKISQNVQHGEDITQQSSGKFDHDQHLGKFEFGKSTQQHGTLAEQSSDFQHVPRGHNIQHREDLTQQASEKFDHNQQLGKFEFDESSQQHEALAKQSSGFEHVPLGHNHQHGEDLTQQTSGKFDHGLEFENSKFDQSSQQHETLKEGSNDFGKIDQNTQHGKDLTHQTSGRFDHDQHLGHFEFGGTSQQHDTLSEQSSDFEYMPLDHYSQHRPDLTQQVSEKFNHDQHRGNFEFDQSSQQDDGSSGFGKMRQKTRNTGDLWSQASGKFEFDQSSQQHETPIEKGFGQVELDQNTRYEPIRTERPDGFGNLELHQKTREDLSQQIGGLENIRLDQNSQRQHDNKKIEISHKNIGYDMKNRERIRDSQIGGIDEPTTSKPIIPIYEGVKGGRRPWRRPTPIPKQSRTNDEVGDTNIPNIGGSPFDAQPELELETNSRDTNTGRGQRYSNIPAYDEKNERRDAPTVASIEQQEGHQWQSKESPSLDATNPSLKWHLTHRPADLTDAENTDDRLASTKNQDFTIGVKQQPRKSRVPAENIREPESRFEPRILQVYGGSGPYDSNHNDEIFSNAKANPSATFSPVSNGGLEPWDIREIPPDHVEPTSLTFPTTASTAEIPPEVPTTTPSPSFWKRIGNKLGNAYEKVKEKATGIFGK